MCVCVSLCVSVFRRLLMLCLQTHICVSCNRLPVYAVSFNLLLNECVSSVDLAAHGHVRFHPLCDGLLIEMPLLHMPVCESAFSMCIQIEMNVYVLTHLLCVFCDTHNAYRNAPTLHLCLPNPSLTKHDP